MLNCILSIAGGFALLCYLYEHLRTPYQILRSKLFGSGLKSGESLKERFGEWAVVTGSSDGIGKAYAQELARHGLNIVLIARNEEKLKAVAEEIVDEYGVRTKIIIADFTAGSQIYDHIEKELDDLQIGIFVNNVGMTAERPGALFKSTRSQVQNLIDTNVVAVSELSRYCLSRMIASKTKGALVNVSSGTEMQPVPNAALYAASKAYTRSLTIALQWEAQPHGILVHLLSPNFVVTKINSYSKKIMAGGLFIPTAKEYARSAVAQLIAEVDQTPGFFWHHLQNALMTAVPTRMRVAIIQLFFNRIVDKKAEKKVDKKDDKEVDKKIEKKSKSLISD